ncbi:MAG: hypothetical protein LWX01_12200 [Deltaproteobacteria bacterium]|nr:hypothetical protein [Deltaproteobacteria bacterium]
MSDTELVWECYCLPGVSHPDWWRETLERCLESPDCPFHYDIRETSIRVWDPIKPEIRVPGSANTCRNGYKLQRMAFGKHDGEILIGISLTRLVFEPGSNVPTFFSAAELFTKGKYPDVLRHEPMIAGIEGLIDFFNQSLSGRQIVRHTGYAAELHASAVTYCFGDRSASLAQIIEPPGLSRNLLRLVRSGSAAMPASIRLGMLSRGVRAPQIAMRIGEEVVGVLNGWRCEASLVNLQGGDSIDDFLGDVTQGQPIVLVPLEGKKGIRPPNSVIEWLRYLDSEKAAFQLCSTASNPLYSRHGLATAILAKADGSIFVAKPDDFPGFHDSWFIGLDLGKGGMNKGKIVVITLTGPSGNLQAYWRARKDNDETLQSGVLQEGLSWIAAEAESIAPRRHLYLLRDGRRPYNESLDSYRKALIGRDFTLIEYLKSGSPLIHHSPSEPQPGTAILPDASDFTALYPCISPQRGVLTTPVKFRAPINPLKHSPSILSRILTALCHSATLSFQPSRLPAPLQWANGLARLSYTDLQFSGWSHRATRLVNMEEY